ncbi:hypothetical protein B0H11DRAFT_1921980 [Mycena galericulata]|nr:hypothetical protein B0H11DRAFT_1921980 [Mycena galericulata]
MHASGAAAFLLIGMTRTRIEGPAGQKDDRRIQHGMEGMETKLGIPYRKGKGMEADEKLELGIIQENTQKVLFIQHDSRPPGGWKKTDDPRNMNSSMDAKKRKASQFNETSIHKVILIQGVVLTKPTGFQGDEHGKRRGDSTGNRGRKCSSFNKLLAEDQEIEHVIPSRVRTKKCRLTNGVKSEGGSTRSTSQINAPDRFVSISESGGDTRREEAEKQR